MSMGCLVIIQGVYEGRHKVARDRTAGAREDWETWGKNRDTTQRAVEGYTDASVGCYVLIQSDVL